MPDALPSRPLSSGERALVAAILLLLFAVWLEPSGSFLAEPDEARYAEIPREMLATRDFVVPRLNGVPYFEKPPLLYWTNAAAMRIFGLTPWAARLPTRLSGLGTLLLVLWHVARVWGRRTGLAAAVLFLASPLAFTFSRLNLTDGLLTFLFAATLLAARETLRRRADRRQTAALSALTGALAAGAFLTKGLIGIVLPGAILIAWSVWTRRWRLLGALLFGPAVPVFFLLAVPWLWAAERRQPGFLQFFFVHEHFQRFATPIASRPGPIYYFVAVFVAGFLPGLLFFFRGLRDAGRRDPGSLFFLLWFAVVLVFFSLSRSKLTPYIFPAFPPAAALAARGFEAWGRRAAPWIFSALAATALVGAIAAVPIARASVAVDQIPVLALVGGALFLAGNWLALFLRRRPAAALSSSAAGWAAFFAALALIYPYTATARDMHELAQTASRASAAGPAKIVFYRDYVQSLSWETNRIIPLAEHQGELESWFLPEARRREIFWDRARFWQAWRSRPLVVVTRAGNLDEFANVSPPARVLAKRGKHAVLTNVPGSTFDVLR